MTSKLICAVIALALSGSTAFAAPHVSAAEAKKIALARVPGTVVHEKLKHGKKKKHDRYNIKVMPTGASKHSTVKKITIDAETGAILEIKNVKAKSYDD